ncbi:MAG: hypothetical protein ACE5KT_00850 [Methanosarcinales archaeon]
MVKEEIFGSRKSIIKEKLMAIDGIKIIDNIWFCTCLYKYNKNPRNRYLIFYYCDNYERFNEDISYLRNFIKSNVPIFKIIFENSEIKLLDIDKNFIVNFSYNPKGPNDKVAKFILGRVNCLSGELIPAKTRVLEGEMSELSKFLRRDLFGRLATTDIDFIVYKSKNLTFIEEKLYLDKSGGSIGKGEYLSFLELLKDVVIPTPSFNWYILFFNQMTGKWFMYDFKKEPSNHKEFLDPTRNETRVLFDMNNLTEINIEDFLETLFNR